MTTPSSTTSQKHKAFSGEPMRDKPVEDLAGIGAVLASRLKEQGFNKAYNVLGQFLLLEMDQELFCDWLKDSIKANSKQSKDCHACLKAWCDEFL